MFLWDLKSEPIQTINCSEHVFFATEFCTGIGCSGGLKPHPDDLASPTARRHRLQHIASVIGAVDVAGAQRTSPQIAELVEHEQRMIAAAAEVCVLSGAVLLAMGRVDAAVHVDPPARQIGERRDICFFS
jgi:hypothetical protein